MDRAFHTLLAGMNTLASVWVLFIVALVSADVIGRAAFNAPLPGVPEIVRFSIVGMVWLQMAYTLRSGNHLRTALALGRMPPLAQRAVLVANSLVGVGLFALITWLGWIEMLKTWEIGAFEGEHPVRIPIWPIWGILVGGAALTALQFALDAVRYLREGPRPSELSDVADVSVPAP
jgi:TRAP-type C4-dicarboxylate transport system permease small subunit